MRKTFARALVAALLIGSCPQLATAAEPHVEDAMQSAQALGQRGQYFRALMALFPYAARELTVNSEGPVAQAYLRYRRAADGEFAEAMLPLVNRGDATTYHRKMAEYNSLLGKNASILPLVETGLLETCMQKLRNGTAQPGAPLLVRARVETIAGGGIMLVNYNGFRVFVKGTPNLGVINGDTVTLGGRYAGTFTYNTVSGSTGTVRSIAYTTHIRTGF